MQHIENSLYNSMQPTNFTTNIMLTSHYNEQKTNHHQPYRFHISRERVTRTVSIITFARASSLSLSTGSINLQKQRWRIRKCESSPSSISTYKY